MLECEVEVSQQVTFDKLNTVVGVLTRQGSYYIVIVTHGIHPNAPWAFACTMRLPQAIPAPSPLTSGSTLLNPGESA